MVKIKKGDKLTIKSKENNLYFYYTGLTSPSYFGGLPCVVLATDLNNKNTYANYSQATLNIWGYTI